MNDLVWIAGSTAVFTSPPYKLRHVLLPKGCGIPICGLGVAHLGCTRTRDLHLRARTLDVRVCNRTRGNPSVALSFKEWQSSGRSIFSSSPRAVPQLVSGPVTREAIFDSAFIGKCGQMPSRELNETLQKIGSGAQWQAVFDIFDGLCGPADEPIKAPNSHIATTVLSIAGRNGDIDRVRCTFAWMRAQGSERSAPTAHTYTAYIQALGTAGEWREAIKVYEEMQQEGICPTSHTYSALIRVCARGGRIGAVAAASLVSDMRVIGVSPDVPVASALICAYGVLGQFNNAERILFAVESALLNTMPAHCFQEVTDALLTETASPDVQSPTEDTKDESVQTSQLESTERKIMQRPDARLYTEFMIAACRCGRPDAAVAIFESYRLPRTTHTCTAAMKAYGDCGDWHKAKALYNSMVRDNSRTPPTGRTYSTLLAVYEKCGQWKRAVALLDDLLMKDAESQSTSNSEQLKVKEIHYNITISACGKEREWLRAENLYNDMLVRGMKPSAVTYSTLIAAYGHGGEDTRANICFREMVFEKKLVPDDYTFVGLMLAPAARGELAVCHEIMLRMSDLGVLPSVHVYNQLIRAADVSSRYETAIELYQKMISEGIEPNATTKDMVQCVGQNGVEFYEDQQLATNFASLVAGLVGMAGIMAGRW